MEFMSRGSRPVQSNQPAANTSSNASPSGTGVGGKGKKAGNLFGLASMVLLFSIVVLALAVLGAIVFGKGPASEFKSVDTSKMQAVFLNGGQVYFGRIGSINPGFMRLNDIYYLRVNQTVQPGQANNQANNDVSLVKLGCELHGPTDEMVINREQIIFWENLKDDGQVAQAVKDYKAQNPEGQKCEQPQPTTPAPAPAPTPAPTPTPPANRR